jgi:iron complex transport system substrate-binding protein
VRIVSLLPSATEIVYALGLGDQLEGRTFECDYPPEAQQKPIVSSSGLPENLPLGEIEDAVRAATAGETPLYRLDEARIAQIQPDLILTQDLCRVCAVPSGNVDEALGRLGCRAEVVTLDPHSLDDVMIDIHNVGRAVGVDARADLLLDNLRARMAAVEASVSLTSVGRFGADADPRLVLVLEWVDPPWGAGHWIPDMVERAGGEPVLGHKGGHADATTWDAVREEAPTIVVVAPCGYHLAEAPSRPLPCSSSWRRRLPVGTTRSGPSTPTPFSCARDPVSSTASSCSRGSSPGRRGTRPTRTRSPASADPDEPALVGDGRVRARG